MEIHRQTCQNCGNKTMLNILVRDAGESDKVFVQCNECEELVARYTIAPRGYYHHGKGFESHLRSINRGGHYESATDFKDGFENLKNVCLDEFEKVKEALKKKPE